MAPALSRRGGLLGGGGIFAFWLLLPLLVAPGAVALFGLRSRAPKRTALLTGARTNATAQTQAKACAIFSDGFSRVTCETDISPKEIRIYYDDWICSGPDRNHPVMPKGSHCRARTRKMTPKICFDFCREYKEAKFFALEGGTCYCEPWYHGWNVVGGPCDFPCEGDPKEMCGSADKASLFEMHFCGGTAGKVQNVLSVAEETAANLNASVAAATTAAERMDAISKAWDLGICSTSKQNVCDLKGHWLNSAGKLSKVVASATHARTILDQSVQGLRQNDADIQAGGDNVTGTMYSALEAQMKVVEQEGKKVGTAGNKVDFVVKQLAGPIGTIKPLANFADLFVSLGNNELKAGSHAICDLKRQGEMSAPAFEAARDKADVSVCAGKCLDMQRKCVAFNVQFYKGLISCQFLSDEGLVRPALLFAVPIFEVSQSRVDKMGFDVIDCYAKKAFIMNNGRGKTKVETLKQVIVE